MSHGGMSALLLLLRKKAFAKPAKVLWKEEQKQENIDARVLSAGGTCLALTEAEMREHIVRSNPWQQSGAKYLCLNIIRFIIWWRVFAFHQNCI